MQAIRNNARFPDPLEAREVASLAYSVASWIWSEFDEIIPAKGNAPILDHSSIAQSWRGTRSGESRRRKTRARDRAIVKAVESGRSMRSVAVEHGIDRKAVSWIVRRGGE